MNLLVALAMAVSGLLSITPTAGQAPFEPRIEMSVQGPFTGDACLSIDDLATPEDEMSAWCIELSIGEGATGIIPFELTGGAPGKFLFTGFLMQNGVESERLNSVVVTVTE